MTIFTEKTARIGRFLVPALSLPSGKLDAAFLPDDIGTGGGTLNITQPPNSPVTLAPDAEITVTHPTVTNERMLVSVFRDSKEFGLTNVGLDFDVGDAGQFVQQDSVNGTQFVGGVVRLKDGMAGSTYDEPTGPMSSNNTPSPYVASATSVNAIYQPYLAFTKSVAGGSVWEGLGPPQTLTLDMGTQKYVTGYRINQTPYPPSAPKDWTFQGSNDGSNWTTLDTRTNVTNWAAENSYTCALPGAYRYVQIVITANNGQAGSTQIAELTIEASNSSFPTGVMYWVRTTDANHFDCSVASKINSVTFGVSIPGSTTLRVLVSFDSRATWKKWSGSAWVTHAGGLGDIANGNTVAEAQAGLTNYTPGPGEFLDFAWGLRSDDAGATPSVSQVTINYDSPTRYDMASVSSYSGNGEFGVRRVSPTTTKIKNKLVTTESVFINIATG